MDFAATLCTNGPSISREDVTELKTRGWNDEMVLETVLITAWANFLFSLSAPVQPGANRFVRADRLLTGNPALRSAVEDAERKRADLPLALL